MGRSVIHTAVLALSALTFAGSVGWSVAAAEPLHRDLILPAPPDRVAHTVPRPVLTPPARWPPPGLPMAAAAPCPARASPAGARQRWVGQLNLNQASAAELEQLPGIGPTKAKRIVRWRRQHGTFRRVIDLRRVSGFGRKTVARLYSMLTVREPSSLHREPVASQTTPSDRSHANKPSQTTPNDRSHAKKPSTSSP